jgi:hypothetical protein
VTVEELGGGSNKSTGDRRRGDEGAATATGAQRAVVRGEVQKEDEGFEGGSPQRQKADSGQSGHTC